MKQEEKQALIDKAEEWVENTLYRLNVMSSFADELLEDFRKTMNE